MNKAISLLTRPLGNRGAFLFSGLLALLASSVFLVVELMGRTAEPKSLVYLAFGFLTGVLLLFRTKAGTTLYWFFLFSLVYRGIENGINFSGVKDAVSLLLGAGILCGCVAIGWEQIEYHFSKRPAHDK